MKYDPNALDAWDKKLFSLLKLDTIDIISPVIESMIDNKTVFIKFMSDGGKRDIEQGRAFKKFLEQEGISFEQGSQERSFLNVDLNGLEKAVGLKVFKGGGVI